MVPRRSACFHQEGSVGLPSWSPKNIVEGRWCTFLCWGILEESLGGGGAGHFGMFWLRWCNWYYIAVHTCLLIQTLYNIYIYIQILSPTWQTNEILSWYAAKKKQATFTEFPTRSGRIHSTVGVQSLEVSSSHTPLKNQHGTWKYMPGSQEIPNLETIISRFQPLVFGEYHSENVLDTSWRISNEFFHTKDIGWTPSFWTRPGQT